MKVIVISPEYQYKHFFYDDSGDGGNSTINMIDTKSIYHWQCEMVDSPIDYPFCGFELYLGESSTKGVDLSKFSTIKLWLEYEGNAETIRVAFRNYDPLYSDKNEVSTTKFNALDINKKHLFDGIEIDFRNFSVPTWWQLNRNLSHDLISPEFNNVVIIDIESGSNHKSGSHDFKLQKIELMGQWLSTETWYLMIMIAWFAFSLMKMIIKQVNLIREMTNQKGRETELLEMNQHLDNQGKKLLAKSLTDALTGAYNRAGAANKIAIAQQEKKESNFAYSIILLDIDYFKFINDTHGHDAGDQVLIELSALVQSNIRSTDYFARWGGEEFMIICRKTTLTTAADIAEQLRLLISTSIIIEDSMVTASFGVAEVDCPDDNAIDIAIKAADTALYKAKKNGRNKVELAEPK